MGPLSRAAAKLPRHRLTTRAAGDVVDRCTIAAGVDAKRISPHSLRHTFALRSLRQKRDVIAVQKLLGHASVATTQRYLDHLGLAERRAAVPTLPLPRGADQEASAAPSHPHPLRHARGRQIVRESKSLPLARSRRAGAGCRWRT